MRIFSLILSIAALTIAALHYFTDKRQADAELSFDREVSIETTNRLKQPIGDGDEILISIENLSKHTSKYNLQVATSGGLWIERSEGDYSNLVDFDRTAVKADNAYQVKLKFRILSKDLNGQIDIYADEKMLQRFGYRHDDDSNKYFLNSYTN
jgi:hypothetical protein